MRRAASDEFVDKNLATQWWNVALSAAGFLIALLIVCIVGALLASVVGRTIWRMVERFIMNTPFLRRVYPYIKQITDFVLTQEEKKKIEKIKKIIDVKIDKEKCTYCSKCVYDCPYNAIKVTKPIEGKISINYELMPKGFKAAADVCPTKAITYDEKKDKLKLEDKWCLFCGACRLVSPENAIILERKRILHEYIESGAWNKALEKLISPEELAKELRIKAENKIRYWILESRVP